MNLDPFADELETVVSVPVFVWHMPEGINVGVLLLHNLGGARLSPDLPCFKRGKFQAIVRHTNYQEGYALAKQVLTGLTLGRKELGSLTVKHSTPIHDPVTYPVSKGDLIEFSVNFETVYVEN